MNDLNPKRKTKTPNGCSQQPLVRRILTTGNDGQATHRADFKHCPHCDHPMENEAWDKAATTLILEPMCYKAGCVSVSAECPKCFKSSWRHEGMDCFQWNDAWPADWKAAVKKREAAVKLAALREWGKGLCHNCKHLESGEIKYHAWRHCIRGCGGEETECPKYEALNSPTPRDEPRANFMKPTKSKKTKRKPVTRVGSGTLVSLRRWWKKRIEDLNNGKNWAINDRVCKEARANKADGVQECVIDLNYLIKHGRAD